MKVREEEFQVEVQEEYQGNQLPVMSPSAKPAKKVAEDNEKNYGWAFFLFCLFCGITVTATFATPAGVLLGMAFGFLFFVKPIYDKVMNFIKRF